MQDYGVLWAGPGLRRPLGQTHAHSRVSYKARAGGSGLYLQRGLENLQGWRLHSLLHCCFVLMGKTFLLSGLNLSCFSLCPLPLSLRTRAAVNSLAPSPWWVSHRCWGAVVGCSHSHPLCRWTSPGPSACPHRACALRWPLDLLQFIGAFPAQGSPKLDAGL